MLVPVCTSHIIANRRNDHNNHYNKKNALVTLKSHNNLQKWQLL